MYGQLVSLCISFKNKRLYTYFFERFMIEMLFLWLFQGCQNDLYLNGNYLL
jgi:hypothetical protein